MAEKQFSLQDFKAMSDELAALGWKHDTTSQTPNAAPTHGPFPGNPAQFGVFSGPGARPGFWSGIPQPMGLSSVIPLYKSNFAQELIDVATSVSAAGSITNQTSACQVGPKPGQLLAARIAATFGIVHASTKIFDVTQAGLRRNRADVDKQLYNTAAAVNPWLPQIPGIGGQNTLETVLRAEAFALGTNLSSAIEQVHIRGNAGTSDNTFYGVATQWNGLDQLIKTGWTDAVTGAAVTGLDAYVNPWNLNIGGADIYARGFVSALIDTYYGQKTYLQSIGIQPDFALVMRPDLFRAVANVWSCAYGTDRCVGSAGNPVNRDQYFTNQMFQDIMNRQYLPMDGDDIPVILDDSIPRDSEGNQLWQSDIYGVMLRGNGRPTLYGEYFDMANAEAMEIVNLTGASGVTDTLNDGMYRVFQRATGGCYEYDFFARVRLITDTPFAHFRFDNVTYAAPYKIRDTVPGFSYYNQSGFSYRS